MARYFAYGPVKVFIRQSFGGLRGKQATVGYEQINECCEVREVSASEFGELKDPATDRVMFMNRTPFDADAKLIGGEIGVPVRLAHQGKKDVPILKPYDELALVMRGLSGFRYFVHLIR